MSWRAWKVGMCGELDQIAHEHVCDCPFGHGYKGDFTKPNGLRYEGQCSGYYTYDECTTR